MLRMSWMGFATPALDWTVLHICFRLDEECSCWVIKNLCCNWNKIRCTLTKINLTSPTSSRFAGMCASRFFGSKWGALLYVDISIWVTKLMTCMRQLQGTVSALKQNRWWEVHTLSSSFTTYISSWSQLSDTWPTPASLSCCWMHCCMISATK